MNKQLKKVSVATVMLWGKEAGAVAWNPEKRFADFEYTEAFLRTGLEISPVTMPLRKGIYSFPALNRDTYLGLPGLLADSLPDRFGNRLLDLWLQRQGRSLNDFSPVERLCYIGTRGMGALEFKPALSHERRAIPLEIAELAALVSDLLHERTGLAVTLDHDRTEALTTIIRIGTSAGGARAKAVIAWNPKTHEVRSGQVVTPPDFEPWILKFDGIQDRELGQTIGHGRIEYAYHLMATAAGIEMTECRLFEEGNRAHFMTRRFDRDQNGEKIHLQSLCGLMHYDFNAPGAYGYEQVFALIIQLGLGYDTLQRMYRRMVFNVLARNQDDHTRNTAFLMDRSGKWYLSPAFDVMWAYNPEGLWTNHHQLRINGKQDDFVLTDLEAPAKEFGIKNSNLIIEEVAEAISRWPRYANEAGVASNRILEIGRTHRISMVKPRVSP